MSIGATAIATPLIVLKQDENNTSTAFNSQIDSQTVSKLSSFSTRWETKTKEQQDVENQFNQYLNSMEIMNQMLLKM